MPNLGLQTQMMRSGSQRKYLSPVVPVIQTWNPLIDLQQANGELTSFSQVKAIFTIPLLFLLFCNNFNPQVVAGTMKSII